ncbi:hypothetical protein Mgra_00000290 [Meloidogyne graminicola]|uniref:Uncharacterized protein n=1 Tax=Meloidogyne graminicola TaxID=189291 RepID=A0A8T0A577_9BILA|nr:hypothetical protein Mgra_00000290 [Meloidogyne graminicola]
MFYQILFLCFVLIVNASTYKENETKSIEEKKGEIVNKCCPTSRHKHYGKRPLYCCQAGLFGAEEDEFLLKECTDLGIKSDLIVKTIRCAQKEIYGEKAADICKAYCCQLFNDNKCSNLCFSYVRRATMSLEILKILMGVCEKNEHYGKYNNCINSKKAEKDAELEEYCKKAIEWFN